MLPICPTSNTFLYSRCSQLSLYRILSHVSPSPAHPELVTSRKARPCRTLRRRFELGRAQCGLGSRGGTPAGRPLGGPGSSCGCERCSPSLFHPGWPRRCVPLYSALVRPSPVPLRFLPIPQSPPIHIISRDLSAWTLLAIASVPQGKSDMYIYELLPRLQPCRLTL